jgi:cyclopropane-fatty-acyl-phospholipid synthase
MGAAKLAFREGRTQAEIELVEHLVARYPRRDFQIEFWDGSIWGGDQPRFTLILRHPGALRRILLAASELALGQAYISDDFDIAGDVEAAIGFGEYLLNQARTLPERLKLAVLLRKLPVGDQTQPGRQQANLHGFIHSKARDRQAISYHYDLPAEFYALWLDRHMVYSCAYFDTPEDELDTAQLRKLDYICRKLRLRPGERLLDVGCGWGGLILHAAKHYNVDALGITLSAPQAEVANERIRQAGLAGGCRVAVCDYRDLEGGEQFDKIASVGMFEHVGEKLLPTYFSQAWQLLKPGGVFLNHGISYSATYHRRGPSFVDRYVFPDSDLVPLSSSLHAAESCGFEVRDVESLREHYALTLRRWLHRLQDHADEARRITGDTTYRVWRIYLSGSAHGFCCGRLNVYQTLLSKPSVRGRSGLPLTREDWYRDKLAMPRVTEFRPS